MLDEGKFNPTPVAGIAMIATMAILVGCDAKQLDEEAVNTRIQPVAKVEIAPSTAMAAGNRSGEEIVQAACAACHATGTLGAPRIGDHAAWGPRLATGLDGLLTSTLSGKNAMPPRGGSDASDTELARAIVYMANKSGANFEEP